MNNLPTQKEFLSFFSHTRFRYIHDVEKTIVQGNDVLDLSWNKKGHGTFFTVNGFPATGEAKQANLLSLNASYVDFDTNASLSQEEISKLIQETLMSGIEAGIPTPTIINRTQKGVHAIWLYPEKLIPTLENIEKWRDVQKRLVHCFNGDTNPVDPSRVLRVPYTLHLKDPANPFEIKIMSYKPETKCSLEKLDAILPKYSDEDLRGSKTLAVDVLRNGVKIGEGLRHLAIAQVAGLALGKNPNANQVEFARLGLYWWDRYVEKSPEPFEQRKIEIDNTVNGLAKLNLANKWSVAKQAVLTCLSTVQSKPVSWLWPGRIALGKLTLIAGDPGLGKSLVTTTLAASVSKGYLWPVDKTPAPIGDVILLSAEDDPADTIKPRLEAIDADCKRIHILQMVRFVEQGKETQRLFSLGDDIEILEKILTSNSDCRLLIIDPVSAYLSGADGNDNSDIRGLLAPLADLAARFGIAIVLVSHLNKSMGGRAIYRTMGSIAFTAAVRAAFVVVKDNDNPDRRLVLPTKNNIAKDTTGLAYSVVTGNNGQPVVAWESEPVTTTAEEALLPAKGSGGEQTDTDWAVNFLEIELANGPVSAAVIMKGAKEVGVKDKPLRCAREELGVVTKKSGFDGGWLWSLPEPEDALEGEDATPNSEGVLDVAGHLRDEKLSDSKNGPTFGAPNN